MNEKQILRLADELAAELDEFLKLKFAVTDAQSRFESREPDIFEIRAVGSILHDVYQNAESIFLRIAKEIDRENHIGADWHRALLDKMAVPLSKTLPPAIQSSTATQLDEYRRFRHVFRNIYGFNLDWTQMKPLLNNAVSTIDAFAVDIEQFIAFLRLMVNDEADSEQ